MITTIDIVFPTDWPWDNRSQIPIKMVRKKFKIYESTTLSDLKQYIMSRMETCTRSRLFLRYDFRLKFESKRCIFHPKKWLGGANESIAILSLYQVHQLPKLLPFQDYRTKYQDYSYIVRCDVKPEFTYDFTKTLGIQQRLKNKNSNNQHTLKNNNVPECKTNPMSIIDDIDNANNNSVIIQNNICIPQMVDSSVADKFSKYKEYTKNCKRLWKKHGLHLKTDDELMELLVLMYSKFLSGDGEGDDNYNNEISDCDCDCKMNINSDHGDDQNSDLNKVKDEGCDHALGRVKVEIAKFRKILTRKMTHNHHKQLGFPLNHSQMACLLLYVNNYHNFQTSFYESQINGNFDKYIVFDYCLCLGITKLNEFNKFLSCNKKIYQKIQLYAPVSVDNSDYCSTAISTSSFGLFSTFTTLYADPKHWLKHRISTYSIQFERFKHDGAVFAEVSWLHDDDKQSEINCELLVRRDCDITVPNRCPYGVKLSVKTACK